MTGNHWAGRVRGADISRPLQDVRIAARELSDQAGHIPGKTGVVMEKVTQILLLGTAAIGGTLGLLHLCQRLTHKQKAHHSDRRPEHQEARSHHPAAGHGHLHDSGSHGR
jgi:hypothetical protein